MSGESDKMSSDQLVLSYEEDNFDLKMLMDFAQHQTQAKNLNDLVKQVIKDYIDGNLVYSKGNALTPMGCLLIDRRIVQQYKKKAKEMGVMLNSLITYALVQGLTKMSPEEYHGKEDIYKWLPMRDSGQSIHCPKCENMEMKVIKVYDIAEIDLCNQCGGLWFDQDELKELIRNEETVRTFDFTKICDIQIPDTVNYKQCFCPVCEDVELRKLPLKRSVGHYINLSVDHCPLCCGYFLDRGEYSKLASPDMLSELRRYLVLL